METRKLLDTLQSSSKKELHRNGITCLTVYGKELYSGGQDTNTFYYDMEVVEKRINEFLLMEAEDIRRTKKLQELLMGSPVWSHLAIIPVGLSQNVLWD